MLTDLTLICHAATAATRAAAFPSDEPIEPAAGVRLDAERPAVRRDARAWTSPMLRARQTAEALGLKAAPEPALAECGYGCWTGLALNEAAADDPAGFAAWLNDPGAAPHGGESFLAVIARVGGWLDARGAEPGRMVAVTHASVIRAALVHALDAGPAAFRRIDVAPLGRVRLRGDGRRWMLRLDPRGG